MATTKAATRAILALSLSGLRPTFDVDSDEDLQFAAQILADCLHDLTDTQLGEAVRAFLRSGDRFWPTPGALLETIHGQASTTGEATLAWSQLIEGRKTRRNWHPLPKGSCAWYFADEAKWHNLILDEVLRCNMRDRFLAGYLLGKRAEALAAQGVPAKVLTKAIRRIRRSKTQPISSRVDIVRHRLSMDEQEEEALWAGIFAVGGWNSEVFTHEAPHGFTAARTAFCKAYTQSKATTQTKQLQVTR